MAAYTSTQNGNWSAQATWGGSGPPGIGDTATIAHTVTVDVDTTVGTSPNDATTVVLAVNTTKSLVIAASKTLTVRGKMTAAFQSFFTMNAGAALVFDNAASGGSPVYVFAPNFVFFAVNGTSGSPCAMSAISGQTFQLSNTTPFDTSSVTYLNVTRMAASNWGLTGSGAKSFTHLTFTSCGLVTFDDNTQACPFTYTDNTHTSTTGSSGSVRLTFASSAGANARDFKRNVLDQFVNHFAKDFTITGNYLGGGLNAVAGRAWSSLSGNFISQNGTLNGGNGALFTGSAASNYYVVANSTGNPHFIAPTALLGADNTVSGSVFESQAPDLIDVGDCVLVKDTATSGGNKIVVSNNIVLPSGYGGVTTPSSGVLVTLYTAAAATLVEISHNTANINFDAVNGRGAIVAVAEGNTGFTGQVPVLTSNIAWGSSANQGYVAERNSGNVKDIITASGADYNWRFNTSAGDNQRGYEDRAAANTMWTAGDAVAAGVDVNGGSGDPLFVDPTRNAAVWCAARGYGAATFTAAKAALQADPSRVTDLIAYVQAGFAPQNTTLRNAGHDGVTIGAVAWAARQEVACERLMRGVSRGVLR